MTQRSASAARWPQAVAERVAGARAADKPHAAARVGATTGRGAPGTGLRFIGSASLGCRRRRKQYRTHAARPEGDSGLMTAGYCGPVPRRSCRAAGRCWPGANRPAGLLAAGTGCVRRRPKVTAQRATARDRAPGP